MKNLIIKIIQWLVGLFFIFSGVVKTIDPIGFSIKLEEYFQVFGLTFLNEFALPIATLFAIAEVILGVFLLLGIFRKFTLWSILALIIFFTFLTFYSAYFDVVKDCGCFGDAIKLTPWQSFGKDLVLLILILILIWGKKHLELLFSRPIGTYLSVISFMAMSFVAYMGINHLPIKDFRPYAVGKNIVEGMKTADELGLEPPKLEVRYIIKNKLNQRVIELSQNDYLSNKKYWQKGSAWELVETKDEIINEGYTPPIHDFIIDCGEKGDMTYYYLEMPKLIMFVTPIPVKTSNTALNRVSKLAEELKHENFPVISVSSDQVVIGDLQNCLMDAITLKTMIRSNPGIILLEKGTVKAKYHWRDTPTVEEINKVFEE